VPGIGGRARGKERPRALSLKERPTGDPRLIGIGVPAATYVEQDDLEKERRQAREQETPGHERDDREQPEENKPQQIGIPADLMASGAQIRIPADALPANVDKIEIQVPEGMGGFGFAPADEEEEADSERPQRLFSIGGEDERASWTEVNARRRMGFKDEGPS
jgi:hypothetical protein